MNSNFKSSEKLVKEYSAEIGKNILKIQAAGGNSSWKENGILWIKASGTWLKDSLSKDIFVPVSLKDVEIAMNDDENADGKVKNTVIEERDYELRPSIETTLHGVIPYKFVIHTHDLGVLSYAIRRDGKKFFDETFQELPHVCVPYVKPGKRLAQAMLDESSKKPAFPKCFFLMNHGLILTSDNFDEIVSLQEKVDYLLKQKISGEPVEAEATERQIDPDGQYVFFGKKHYSIVASDDKLLDFLNGKVIFPDQAIFLGISMPVCNNEHSVREEIQRETPFFCNRKRGFYLHNSLGEDKRECLDGLTRLISSLDDTKSINSLTSQQIYELVNWEAEKYRQKLK